MPIKCGTQFLWQLELVTHLRLPYRPASLERCLGQWAASWTLPREGA